MPDELDILHIAEMVDDDPNNILMEDRVQQLRNTVSKLYKKFNNIGRKEELTPEQQKEIFDATKNIMSAVPKAAYWPWIAKLTFFGDITLPEDEGTLQANLRRYEEAKRAGMFDKKLTEFETMADLYTELQTVQDVRGKRTKEKEFKKAGADVIIVDDPYTVVMYTRGEAAAEWGQVTNWCTSSVSQSNDYIKQGNLYIIFEKSEKGQIPLLQIHFPSGQFMNASNSQDEEMFRRLNKYLKEIAENYIGMPREIENAQKRGLLPEDPNSPIMQKVNERAKTNPQYAYNHAVHGQKGSWKEAEPYIMKHPYWAAKYAADALQARWPEAEPTIMKDPPSIVEYAANVIKGRWPEAEKYILHGADRSIIVEYAKRVIKGPWEESEPFISKDPNAAYEYVKQIHKEPYPPLEPAIMKSPNAAVKYSKDVMGGRWEEAEDFISKQSPHAYTFYLVLHYNKFEDVSPHIQEIPDLDMIWRTEMGQASKVQLEIWRASSPEALCIISQGVDWSGGPQALEVAVGDQRVWKYPEWHPQHGEERSLYWLNFAGHRGHAKRAADWIQQSPAYIIFRKRAENITDEARGASIGSGGQYMFMGYQWGSAKIVNNQGITLKTLSPGLDMFLGFWQQEQPDAPTALISSARKQCARPDYEGRPPILNPKGKEG